MSTSATLRPVEAIYPARLKASVVFPEPPFGFRTTILRRSAAPLKFSMLLHRRRDFCGGPICTQIIKGVVAAVLAVGIVLAAESRIYDPMAQKSETTRSAIAAASAKGVFSESPCEFGTLVLRRSVVPLKSSIWVHHRRESCGGPIWIYSIRQGSSGVLADGIVFAGPTCSMVRCRDNAALTVLLTKRRYRYATVTS